MKSENFEKNNKELHKSVEQLLIRNGFSLPTNFFGIKLPVLVERTVNVGLPRSKKAHDKNTKTEFLTLIPIYNIAKDGGEKVWDYRGTIMTDVRGNLMETSFGFYFSSVTQLFDYLEEDKW